MLVFQRRVFFLTFCFVGIILFSSCHRQVRYSAIDKDRIIKKFVLSCFLTLNNSKPSQKQNDSIVALLAKDFSEESKSKLVSELQKKPEYFRNIEIQQRIDYLNNLSTSEIVRTKAIFDILSARKEESVDFPFSYRSAQLGRLLTVADSLRTGNTTYRESEKLIVSNHFYDQINMNQDNFVRSCFLNFLHRYPTRSEFSESLKMLDDKGGILFLKYGQSKFDFINILFNSAEYNESVVNSIFKTFFYRKASDNELINYTQLYSQTDDFALVQRKIICNSSGDSSEVMLKQPAAYFSIAYYDILGKTIPPAVLKNYMNRYLGFGDKYIIKKGIIEQMLSNVSFKDKIKPGAINLLVNDTYLRFYGRRPSNEEMEFICKKIMPDTEQRYKKMILSMALSDEYMYY